MEEIRNRSQVALITSSTNQLLHCHHHHTPSEETSIHPVKINPSHKITAQKHSFQFKIDLLIKFVAEGRLVRLHKRAFFSGCAFVDVGSLLVRGRLVFTPRSVEGGRRRGPRNSHRPSWSLRTRTVLSFHSWETTKTQRVDKSEPSHWVWFKEKFFIPI